MMGPNGYGYRYQGRIFILMSLLLHSNLFLSLEYKDSDRVMSSNPTQGAQKKGGKDLSFLPATS